MTRARSAISAAGLRRLPLGRAPVRWDPNAVEPAHDDARRIRPPVEPRAARTRRAAHDADATLRPDRSDRLRGRRPAPPGRSAYATAKNAQFGLTRSWARELAPFGITVNTVAPGFIPVERHAHIPDATRNAYLASVPAGRMGTREDIAHAVSFFASQAAGFVTGQRLVVDGGRALRE